MPITITNLRTAIPALLVALAVVPFAAAPAQAGKPEAVGNPCERTPELCASVSDGSRPTPELPEDLCQRIPAACGPSDPPPTEPDSGTDGGGQGSGGGGDNGGGADGGSYGAEPPGESAEAGDTEDAGEADVVPSTDPQSEAPADDASGVASGRLEAWHLAIAAALALLLVVLALRRPARR